MLMRRLLIQSILNFINFATVKLYFDAKATLPININIKKSNMRRMSKSCRAFGLLFLFLMFPLWVSAQNTVTIKGVISDDDGPVIGATVKEKGASGGGNF